MTATDEQHGQLDTGYPHTLRPELHKALMARGIDYWVAQGITFWNRDDGCECLAYGYKADGVPKLAIKVVGFTDPEQAIAATLGSEDTYTREDVEGAFVSGYSLGLDMFDSSKPDGEKGWNQNERNMDEEMEELGWVRVDAATLGAMTCEADETDTWECVRDDLGGYGKTMTVYVMECTECGHTYEHVNGDYEYYPRCGRKRRDFVE